MVRYASSCKRGRRGISTWHLSYLDPPCQEKTPDPFSVAPGHAFNIEPLNGAWLSAARSSGSRRRQAGSTLKNVNLAKVRSAIGVTIALVWSVGWGRGPVGFRLTFSRGRPRLAPAPAAKKYKTLTQPPPPPPPARTGRRDPRLASAGVSVRRLAGAGLSPGLMSAGLGSVPAEQTYLDIGQGNRVFDSLYDSDLPAAAVPLNRPVVDPALLRRASRPRRRSCRDCWRGRSRERERGSGFAMPRFPGCGSRS